MHRVTQLGEGFRLDLSDPLPRDTELPADLLQRPHLAVVEAEPEAGGAVLLRRADEAAKTPGRQVDGLETWLSALRAMGG